MKNVKKPDEVNNVVDFHEAKKRQMSKKKANFSFANFFKSESIQKNLPWVALVVIFIILLIHELWGV